jgi:hypothetical protein
MIEGCAVTSIWKTLSSSGSDNLDCNVACKQSTYSASCRCTEWPALLVKNVAFGQRHTLCGADAVPQSGHNIFSARGARVMHLNKRATIQDILEKNGYSDWYIAEPSKRNSEICDGKWVLLNFVESKRADFIILDEWFHCCQELEKLIRLAIQHSVPFWAYRFIVPNGQPK